MSNLVSLPASLRAKLEESDRLVAQGSPSRGLALRNEVVHAIAVKSPELATLLSAAPLGFSRLASREGNLHRQTVEEDIHICGFRVAQKVTTTYNYRETVREWELGR